MRLDQYVAQFWPEHSRSTWQKYIALGYVQVNGLVQTSSKQTLDEDDVVTTHLPAEPNYSNDSLPVVYQDEHVVVVNKPAGILTHAKGAISEEFTVADFVRTLMAEEDTTNRPGIVHRLDRDTSGVIIAALDSATKGQLQKQFQDRKAKKTYLAIVRGTPKQLHGRIDLPIERNPKKPSQHRVGVNGKPAQTDFRVLGTKGVYSAVELKPITGRTHQLRVHLAYLGVPIAGDSVYGTTKSPIGRLCLHAKELEITIPEGQRKIFTVDPPADFQTLLEDITSD